MNRIVKQPCDEGAIRSSPAVAPCPPKAGRWILAATILGSSMAFIDGTVVNVALPTLQSRFNATAVDVQWVIEAYSLLLAALLLAGGSLGDMYGRKRIFSIGVVLFAAASVGCGFARNIDQLILARAVEGVGGALLVPGSLAIIGASFSDKDRGRAIGTWSGFLGMSTALGPVIGGWLIEHASWRWVFFINLPIGALTFLLTTLHVPESRNPDAPGRLDWVGTALVTAGLGGVIYALIESSSRGWGNQAVAGSLLLGLVALAAFFVVEARSRAPMLPLKLFRSRDFSGANLLTLFLYGALSGSLFFLPLNLIQVQGYSATAAGSSMLPFIILTSGLSRWAGGLVDRYGARVPLVVGPALAAVGFALFSAPSIGGSYWTRWFPAMAVLGLGMAVSIAPLTTTVMNSVGREQSGIASGVNNAVASIAEVLAIAVFGAIMLGAFSQQLASRLADVNVPPAVRQKLDDQRLRLAAAQIPAELDGATAATVKRSIDESFVVGYRRVMLIAAALALGAAACAWLMIGSSPKLAKATKGKESPSRVAPSRSV
ncbi:MAG TPA: MFS transporter [Blastocatellia bacterium]